MYLKISRDKLSELLSIAGKAISPNSPMPILSGIKFDIYADRIELTGSDSNITIKTWALKGKDFIYEADENGSIVINKNYITEIIRNLDSDVVEMEVTDGSLTKITGSTAVFNINGFRSADYPLIDLTLPEKQFEIAGATLKKIAAQTGFAASTSESRPSLTGINLTSDKQYLRAVATDSYRLAKKKISLPIPYEFNITVYAKSLSDIAKTFVDDEKVTVALSEKKAQFRSGTTIIQTRLIDGSYPDTSRFVPTEFAYDLTMDARQLLSAIARSSFIKSDNDQFAIIKLNLSDKEVVMTTHSQEIGSSLQPLAVDSYKGEPLEISFSAKYVYDAVSGLDGDKIRIRFSGQMKPFVITSPSDDTTLQLVLPVRTFN